MTHTPKPWIATQEGLEFFITTADDLIIAMTLKGDGSDEAAALMVAAAPELLEACRAAVTGIEEELLTRGILCGSLGDTLLVLRAAIARATSNV